MAFDQNSVTKDLTPINIPYVGVGVGVVDDNWIAPPPPATASAITPSRPVIFHYQDASGFPPSLGFANTPQPHPPSLGFPTANTIITPSPFAYTPILSSAASDQASEDGADDSASGKKVKLLCSFGGKIMPRPSDSMLRYVGGHTRIISVRRDVSLPDLVHKMTDMYGQSVVIKYQIPNEDLDALVSVSCPDDLDNMMEEYHKLLERSSDGSAKLRVFLFSASELDPSGLAHLGNSQDTGQRYVDAVNSIHQGIGGGITRKENIASDASTQNSDVSAPDNIDALVTKDVPPPPSTPLVSPKTDSPCNDNVARTQTCVPALTLPNPPPPITIYSKPEIELERSIPLQSPLQQPPRYKIQQTGLNFPPPLSPHLGGFVDPHHDASGHTNYQMAPPQMVYANPQTMGAARPLLIQPQYRDSCPTLLTQQFVPAVHMTMTPTSSHLSANPNVRPLAHKVVTVPTDQSYNQAYQPQVTEGFGCNQVTPRDHGASSEGWQPHQRGTPRTKCQETLPHTYSDTVAQNQKDNHLPIITTEVNSLHQSPQVDDISRFSIMSPQSQRVTGLVSDVQIPYGISRGNLPATLPEDSTRLKHLVSPSQMKQEVFASKPVSVKNTSVCSLSSQTSEQFLFDTLKDYSRPSHGVTLTEDIPRSSIPNLRPIDLRKGNIQISSTDLLASNKQGRLPVTREAFVTRDAQGENHFGIEAHLMDGVQATLEQFKTSKGSPEEQMKQQLQASAEGKVASVIDSSLPLNLNFSSPDTDVSISRASHEMGGQTNSAEVIQNKMEIMNLKPEKTSFGFPLSDSIGRLQIIKNNDLEELRELGSGAFGTVYHGKWRGTDVAIKRINDRCFGGKTSEQERMRSDFWNEAIKLADLHHPNVVAFYGVVLDGPSSPVATVTEYMVNGSLRTALQKNERNVDKRKRLLILMDVAFGMEYLHSKNIVHFDLKSDNLLVNLRDPHRPICKVGDLGLSKVKCKTLISGGVRGTLPWMAPELLNGSSSLVSDKVDVFSFGIVMWELLTGEEPYTDLHYGAIIGGIVSNTLRPTVPKNCDPEWRSLMERCWSAEPSERPNFTEIANELRFMTAKVPLKG